MKRFKLVSLIAVGMLTAAAHAGETGDDILVSGIEQHGTGIVHIEDGPVLPSVLYADGAQVDVETSTVWRYVCGSDVSGLTENDLAITAQAMKEAFADPMKFQQIGGGLRSGLNLVFNVSGSLPGGAQAALDRISAYYGTVFADNITVTVNFSMASMGGGVLGATSSAYANSVTWNNTRTGLINGMDLDDTIQSWLPSGSTIPVRYNGGSSTITNETRCFFTLANYNATIGTLAGTAASMTLNTNFPWDYDESNGVSGSLHGFESVVVHEVGHALGFTSGADFRSGDIEALDIYRFQRTDGAGDYNPDTLAEFQTTPRTVDWNTPDDDVNSDLIDIEYRMADGNPNQASHFRSEFPAIGIMDPNLSSGESFWPDFLRESDLNMFDAIGWDFFAGDCNGNGVLDDDEIASDPGLDCQPDGTLDECQLNGNDCNSNLVPDECDLPGNDCNATGIPDDCELAGNDCDANLNPDECDAADLAASLINPTDEALCAGDTANFTVGAPPGSAYQWFDGAGSLSNGGRISGVMSDTLVITNVGAADEDDYYCEVDDACIVADSQTAALGVVPSAISITQEPVAQVIICTSSGQGAAFEMNVDNALAVTYQWYKDGAPLTNDSRISGATTNRIEISPVETGDLGFYTCHAENPCGGSVDTDLLRGELVVADPIYTTQPEDTCVNTGGNTTFSVTVVPSNTLLFWYRDGAQLSNGTDGNGMVIAGATTDTLQLSNVPTAYDQSEFYVVGFNPNPVCQGDSDVATLTVGGCLPCCLAADVNCDGTADVLDLGVVRQGTNWNQSPPTGNPRADVTGDGVADVLDLGTIRQGANWNVSTGPCDCGCSQ